MRRIASRIMLVGLLALAVLASAGCYRSVSFGFHDGYRPGYGYGGVSYGYYGGHGYHGHHGGHGHYNDFCDY